MAKVDRVIEIMERRIACGDYALRPLPAETRLAEETGVSRMTARKAVLNLLERGLLERTESGRLIVPTPKPATTPKGKAAKSNSKKVIKPSAAIAFALPAHESTEFARWRKAADTAMARFGLNMRMVHFHHWDDPILSDAFDNFDGLFLLPPAEKVPEPVVRRMQTARARIVALDADLTPHGIRSVDLVPPSSIQRLLDHLASLGHRAIHCVNSQPMDTVIEERIGQWNLWRVAQNAKGELLNEPDKSYGDPIKKGYELLARRLDAGPLNATALLCLTMPAAIGAARAMYEHGIIIGRDVSLCAANDEGLAAYLCPSLTATRMPDPLPYLMLCVEWMTGASHGGPLLSRPPEVPLFIGESTAAPRK